MLQLNNNSGDFVTIKYKDVDGVDQSFTMMSGDYESIDYPYYSYFEIKSSKKSIIVDNSDLMLTDALLSIENSNLSLNITIRNNNERNTWVSVDNITPISSLNGIFNIDVLQKVWFI
jgi:hypothetical protein